MRLVQSINLYSNTAANAVIFSLYSHWVAFRLDLQEVCMDCSFTRADGWVDLVCVVMHIPAPTLN